MGNPVDLRREAELAQLEIQLELALSTLRGVVGHRDPFRAGDVVKHIPSDEEWILALDEHKWRVIAGEWLPGAETSAPVSEVALLRRATPEVRTAELRRTLNSPNHQRHWALAKEQLDERPAPASGVPLEHESISVSPDGKPPRTASIPMRLPCPACGVLHLDEGEWATKPHHTHACQFCGNVWRPVVPTVGFAFLPGFKNETDAQEQATATRPGPLKFYEESGPPEYWLMRANEYAQEVLRVDASTAADLIASGELAGTPFAAEFSQLMFLASAKRAAADRITELQAATAAVEERRRNDLSYQVAEFSRAFGYAVHHSPRQPTKKEMWLRIVLIAEEFCEVLEAAGVRRGNLEPIKQALAFDTLAPVDLPALAKELADLDYVVEGTRLACGIPRQAVANIVHESNMAKRGGATDENGKLLKPPGWQKPDIAGLLRRFGWMGR